MIIFGLCVSFIALEIISRFLLDPSPTLHELDPFLGYRLVPNSVGKFSGYIMKINSKGIRDREYSYSKEYPFTRIVVLGDSFTFGLGVKDYRDTYPKIIEDSLLNAGYPVEVINLGVGGYNTSQEINFFKIEGFKYNPDLIILTFNLSDNGPVSVDIPRIRLLQKYHILNIRKMLGRNIYAITYLKKLILKFLTGTHLKQSPRFIPESSYSGCVNQITGFSRYLEGRDVQLLVFILPEIENFQNYQYSRIHDYIRSNLLNNGVICYDLLPDFRNHNLDPGDIRFRINDPHLNELGHKYLASFMLPKLRPFIENQKKRGP